MLLINLCRAKIYILIQARMEAYVKNMHGLIGLAGNGNTQGSSGAQVINSELTMNTKQFSSGKQTANAIVAFLTAPVSYS